jgi:hypothetical protein
MPATRRPMKSALGRVVPLDYDILASIKIEEMTKLRARNPRGLAYV